MCCLQIIIFMKKIVFLLIVMMASQQVANAQMKPRFKPRHKTAGAPAAPRGDDDDDDGDMEGMTLQSTINLKATMHMSEMSSGASLNLPMSRDGSGTAWNPDETPMYGYMTHSGTWKFMLGGNIFLRYNKQDIFDAGKRGGSLADAPDMLMGTAQTRIGRRGLLHFNAMFSTDAFITGGAGYPLLFQTGESWNGLPLADHQHPHDLLSELSASYTYAFSEKKDATIYVGYPGSPALGPVAFMHRPSGMFMPDAPLGHHWQDATHISFGVATLGFRYSKFKLEASSFTGREPDEDRFGFDNPTFNSFSSRLSYCPTENWALQISRAYIKSPEAVRPKEDVDRTTASATYVYQLTRNSYTAVTALWGQNATSGHPLSNALLLEATYKVKLLTVYGRYEWVQKSGEDLSLDPSHYQPYGLFAIQSATAGLSADLFHVGHINISPGIQATVYHADASLNPVYGQYPVGGEVYLHFYPYQMK